MVCISQCRILLLKVNLAVTEKSQTVAEKRMVSSCEDIMTSIVAASDGEKNKVEEYFQEVALYSQR